MRPLSNLLLSLPPRADGSFDEETHRILREIGRWNRANGAAIFGTRPWTLHGEGPVRFTRSKDGTHLFAILLEWPEDGRTTLPSLAKGGRAGRLGHYVPTDSDGLPFRVGAG